MTPRILITLLLVCFGLISFGQTKSEGSHDTYKLSAGLRLGTTPGFSLKTFTSSNAAIEVLLHTRRRGWLVTGLYEIHKQAFDVPRLHWYYGIGGHAGYYYGQYFFNNGYNNGNKDKYMYPLYYNEDPKFNFGVDGILGIEYHIEEIPFTIGLDVKPYIDVLSRFWPYMDGALTIRYVIK